MMNTSFQRQAWLYASLWVGVEAVAATPLPREVISVQEAQQHPRIDKEQLRPPKIRMDAPSVDRAADLAALEDLANAPAAKTAEGRKQQAQALWQLGLLQLHGLHLPPQPQSAQALFERAYALGYSLAAAGLVWCAIDGCGQAPRPQEARQWLPALRQVAPARAAFFDWLLLDALTPLDMDDEVQRLGPGLERNQQQALAKAVKAGDPYAQVEWGMQLAAQDNNDAALAQFRLAAATSEAAKRNIQILSEQSGRNLPPSGQVGQAGSAWQTYRQARVYHRGEGVPANYTEAIRLYKRAADMGSEPAKRMLALIYSRPQADGNLDVFWMQQLAYADVEAPGGTAVVAPKSPTYLQRDPTPLYDYIAPRWRKAP